MKQKILIASENQDIIEQLNDILLTLEYSSTMKKLKTIWVVFVPENEFHDALMSIIPFVEVLDCAKNLFWAFNNKKQTNFENVIAVANTSTIEEFKRNIESLTNKGLSN